MTITTYAGLQTAIGDFLNRSDLTSVIPTFIQLAHADLNRKLRTWQMEARATLTLDAEYVDLPADWLETIRLDYNGQATRRLLVVPPSEISRRPSDTDEPMFFTHIGRQVRLWPVPSSGTGDLRYYQSIPALADDNTSNWLLALSPDAYLYGSLVHSAPYLQEDARLAAWVGLYGDALSSTQRASDRAGWSSGMRLT